MKTSYQYIFVLLALLFGSCKKLVDIGPAKGQQDMTSTFSEDGPATAAVLILYADNSFSTLTLPHIAQMTGLAADELFSNVAASNSEYLNNNVSLNNQRNNDSFWKYNYSIIQKANLCLFGLNQSKTLSAAVKNQLIGETKFMRAYAFFNLLNLYGGVPLSLSTSTDENATSKRNSPDEVWVQIFSDLNDAKALLKPEYPSDQRVRANRYAVSALLARAYLYHQDWLKAEAEASAVISSNVYRLSNPAETFQNTSNETILQLFTTKGISPFTNNYLPSSATNIPPCYLRTGFESAFEFNTNSNSDDLRKTNWTAKLNNNALYVRKYKTRTGTGNEFTILLRLAELYLIRAEARTQLNLLNGVSGTAQADVNVIRLRAGLLPKPDLDQKGWLQAIEQERKVELFGEYGHRWFDLKRNKGFTDPTKSRADEILSVLKGNNWQATDALFPIPAQQFLLNKNLVQNPGYE
jgi:hypothetical protein